MEMREDADGHYKLRDQVQEKNRKYWPTPTMQDYKRRGPNIEQQGLLNVVDGNLNPDWVEWLMGWPLGMTRLEPLSKEAYERWLSDPRQWEEEPECIPRVTTEKINRAQRLKAIGNGQVPIVAATAWTLLWDEK